MCVCVCVSCSVLDKTTFYRRDCASVLNGQGYNTTAIANVCNWMGYCGFPVGDEFRNTNTCNLYPQWLALNSSTVPTDAKNAVCPGVPAGDGCPW